LITIGFDFQAPGLSTLVVMSLINQLTAQQLRKAADLKDQIAALQKQLNQLAASSGGEVPAPLKAAKPARNKISAAGIAKIRAAQKARWAKIKGAKAGKALVQRPAAKKRTLSDAARAKMAAAAKARWAKIKAARK
jgi:hypothetical protein